MSAAGTNSNSGGVISPFVSNAVTSLTAADTSIVIAGTAAAPTVATGTLDVIAADHPPAADWSNNSHKITALANGTAASDAAAFGQVLSQKATTGTAGFNLANSTTDIITWTAPNDGAMHRVIIITNLHVSSAETGGQVNAVGTRPDAGAFSTQVLAGGQGTNQNTQNIFGAFVQANTAVAVHQQTALTAGAAVVWAEIWGS